MIDAQLKNAPILIVDDQQANIDILEGLLEMQGYTNFRSTADPREVISLYASFEPELILLDLMMPYLSGFEVMNQLSSLISASTYLPILVLTADITPEAKQRALSGGATDFLTKPFDLTEVALRIKNLLFISYLQKQLQKQNLQLEERVRERTAELEQKNAELIIAKEKAEASDRLKAAFINNISHEIRTPLNGILGFGQMLAEYDLLPEEKEEYLEMMNRSSNRLINTITDYMDIALLNSGSLEVTKSDFDPAHLIHQVRDKFEGPCKSKGLTLTTLVPEIISNPIINADRSLIAKVLNHLVDNAVKFTSGGSVTLGFVLQDNSILFNVNDTGVGIDEKNNDQIFHHFMQEDSTTTRGHEGSGLGLTIAKGISDLLGGKMWFTSEKNKGTSFYFSLPGVALPIGGQELINTDRLDDHRSHTLLVVEDDDINYKYLNILLKHPNIHLIHVKNGTDAIECCRCQPEIDMVLMDLKIGEVDGFEATRQIKAYRKDLPVIAVTAYSGIKEKEYAQQSGCNAFLIKPVKRELLYSKLSEYGICLSHS